MFIFAATKPKNNMKYNHERTPAVRRMMAAHGVQGYGLYWLLREEIAAQGGQMDVSNCDLIAFETGLPTVTVHSIALDYGLFTVEGDVLRDGDLDRCKKQAAEAATTRWRKSKPTAKQARKKPAAKVEQAEAVEAVEIVQQPPQGAEVNERYQRFTDFVKRECPYLSNPQHITQLTPAELDKLLADYDANTIADTMRDLENRKDKRKQYVSLYRTLLNWLKNGKNRKSNTDRNSPMDAAKQGIVGRMQFGIG